MDEANKIDGWWTLEKVNTAVFINKVGEKLKCGIFDDAVRARRAQMKSCEIEKTKKINRETSILHENLLNANNGKGNEMPIKAIVDPMWCTREIYNIQVRWIVRHNAGGSIIKLRCCWRWFSWSFAHLDDFFSHRFKTWGQIASNWWLWNFWSMLLKCV